MANDLTNENLVLISIHTCRLFCLYPKRTLDFCSEQAKEVSLEFVQYLCTKSENPLQYFFYYAKQSLMTVPKHTRFKILLPGLVLPCCHCRLSMTRNVMKGYF